MARQPGEGPGSYADIKLPSADYIKRAFWNVEEVCSRAEETSGQTPRGALGPALCLRGPRLVVRPGSYARPWVWFTLRFRF